MKLFPKLQQKYQYPGEQQSNNKPELQDALFNNNNINRLKKLKEFLCQDQNIDQFILPVQRQRKNYGYCNADRKTANTPLHFNYNYIVNNTNNKQNLNLKELPIKEVKIRLHNRRLNSSNMVLRKSAEMKRSYSRNQYYHSKKKSNIVNTTHNNTINKQNSHISSRMESSESIDKINKVENLNYQYRYALHQGKKNKLKLSQLLAAANMPETSITPNNILKTGRDNGTYHFLQRKCLNKKKMEDKFSQFRIL